jgi:hypothetical protein
MTAPARRSVADLIEAATDYDRLTEKQWQSLVLRLARATGWLSHHHRISQGSTPGWPDLVLIGHGRALFLELKTARGRIRPPQLEWLRGLAAAGLEVGLLRPADIRLLRRALGPEQHRLIWKEPA